MMKKCLLFFLLIATQAYAIPITLEYAKTEEEIAWGLMQRKSLPPNHGMLFTFIPPRQTGVWSFNCLLNLSVAFLDEQGTIQEIHELRAYPERMDAARPVRCLADIAQLYPTSDPIRRFFIEHAIASKGPVAYLLEMNEHWFEKHGVKVGDKVVWDEATGKGEIY